MPNPFEFLGEIRSMNSDLCEKLDMIIERLDLLIDLADAHNQLDAGEGLVWTEKQKDDLYGDGK